MDTRKASDQSGYWTNERHSHFLNSMEASFVRTMLEDNGRVLRLDRYLPDSADSTEDLKKERPRRHLTSDDDNLHPRRQRTEKKTRRPSSQPHTSSEDQVVPHFCNGAGAKDD